MDSTLLMPTAEKEDYGHALKLSLPFLRTADDEKMLDYRDMVVLQQGSDAKEIINSLRALADRIKVNCIQENLRNK